MFNRLKNSLSVLLLLTSLCSLQAAVQDSVILVKGTVFEDKNGNGKQDKGEPTLKNILVSNGKEIVSSDRKGAFVIHAQKGQSVFPILPASYEVSLVDSKVSNANFLYLNPNKVFSDTLYHAVPVVKLKESKERFTMGAIGDIQVDSKEEVGFAARSIFSELAERKDLAFNMMLGDLVNNKMELLTDVKDMMNMLPKNSWTLVGNHDRNVDNPSFMNDVFNAAFGADHYAFNYGEVHFVVLNNVFSTGKHSYEGRVDEEQLVFLANDLKYVPKHKTIVINQHIPMAHTKNRKDIFKLLEGYSNVLILTGHTHTVNRYFFNDTRIQELGVGATCGNWWRGEKNRAGVPEAVMQCGTPRGYFSIQFDKGRYSFQYKAVGLDGANQVSLMQEGNVLLANVYAGSDSTLVRVRIDAGDWQSMSVSKRVDPYVAQIVEKNRTKVFPTLDNTVNPLGKRTSSHVWELALPIGFSEKINKIEVVAFDKYGLDIKEEFLF